jgi:hypothetical protein
MVGGAFVGVAVEGARIVCVAQAVFKAWAVWAIAVGISD